MARRESAKKRSIPVVCEHFEPIRNAAMDPYSDCQNNFPIGKRGTLFWG